MEASPPPESTTSNATDNESIYNDYEETEDEIIDDMDFLEHSKKAKKILDIDDIDELKPRQAELLRIELAKIIMYVIGKVQAERETEEESTAQSQEQEQEQYQESTPVAPAPTPESQTPTVGGYKKKSKTKGNTKRVKGGDGQPISSALSGSMDGTRILNTSGMINTDHDPRKIEGSAEVVNANSVHRPFSSGNTSGISSIGGLSQDDIKTLLPYYGTGGKARTKSNKTKNKK